jgi:hypothetical protein
MTDTVPLELIPIDDRSEEALVEQARLRVYTASSGLLNDFSENSAIAALIQGQGFAASEFLYRVNKLPLNLVIAFLSVAGVQRRLGTKASVSLTFSLTAPLTNSFFIPQDFEVLDESGQFSFYTTDQLEIPPGLIQGSVGAIASQVGSGYNLAAYQVNTLTQPLTFLSGVVNIQAAAGGTDAETVYQAIERGLIELRTKNLVTADDYEAAAESIMGQGSVCKAIGMLSANKLEEQRGAVHLFLLNADGSPATSEQQSLVVNALKPRIQLGTSLYASPMELLNISANLIAKISSDKAPESIADELWLALEEYLSPTNYPSNQDIILDEIKYVLRNTGLIENVTELTLNDKALNIPLPNDYTLPIAYSLYLQLISPDGFPYDILRGAGEPIEFDGVEIEL